MNKSFLVPSKNSIILLPRHCCGNNQWHTPNQDPGAIKIVSLAGQWSQSLFAGLALVIVQAANKPGDIIITVTANELNTVTFTITAKLALQRSSAD